MIPIPPPLAIWRYRHLIVYKAWADFRKESQRTRLGWVWWILNPTIEIAIYYVVFGLLFQRGGESYIALLTVGIVTFNWFRTSVSTATNAIQANGGFVKQVPIRKIVFPLSTILMVAFQFAFSLAVQFAVLAVYGFLPTIYWLWYPLVLAVEVLLILGVTLPFAAFVPFVPDLHRFVNYALRLAFFLSCVVYGLDITGPFGQQLLLLNPMVHVILSARDALMYEQVPRLSGLFVVAAGSIAAAYIGAWCIHRFDSIYAKRMVN